MLLKATGAVPHVGGQLTKPGTKYYEIIRRWIAEGAVLDLDAPRVASIDVQPLNPVIQAIGAKQQIFAPALDVLNGRTRQDSGDFLGDRPAQAAVPDHDILHQLALCMGQDAAAGGFDFG